MNDIARSSLVPSDRSRIAETPQVRLRPGWADRLALAASMGLTVASPRSALLVAGVLGPRLAGPTSTSTTLAAGSSATRDRATRDRRTGS